MRAVERRARALVSRLGESPVGVEVGVFRGEMSEWLLKLHPRLKLYMVDPWKGNAQPRHRKRQEQLRAEAATRTSFAQERREIVARPSLEAASDFADGSLDFVFIDGDHTHDAVVRDIEAWLPKVKPEGVFGGHDYVDVWPGVKRAVDEAVERHGWTLILGDDWTWWRG